MDLKDLESRSLDVDFIDEEQLKRLMQPQVEEKVEPIEKIETKQLEIEEEKTVPEPETVEPQPAAEEQPVEEDDTEPVEETSIPEEEIFEPPSQSSSESDRITEIESIKSAIPVEKISREEVKKQFSSIVKNLKIDLNKRNESVEKKTQKKAEERTSEKRVTKVKTIVADNQNLFGEKRIVAKWKQFPLSRVMRRKYQVKVDEVIKKNWNLPYEMDPSLEARVKVIVSKSGKILNYEIVESSQNRFFNHTVIQLFKNLDQLPPLPEEFAGESTEIGLRFTSQQFNSE